MNGHDPNPTNDLARFKKLKRAKREKHPREETANQITHAAGAVLSLVALVVLVLRAWDLPDTRILVSHALFGVSLCLLYTASFLYHSARDEKTRHRLKILDHSAIYVLIAGSYTPFMATVLTGTQGTVMLTVVWTLALLGVAFKTVFVHRFKIISTLVYLAMGWIVVFVFRPLAAALPAESLTWLVAGGASYSVGVVFYLADRMRYNHAAWHLFVLAGSTCHFFAVLASVPALLR